MPRPESGRRVTPRFDRVVVVDGSAGSTPARGRDSMWLAVAEPGRDDPVLVANPATRHEAFDVLSDTCGVGGSSLVAVDWSLGYPSGTAAALGLGGVPWQSMWELLADHIDDDERNRNNRFRVAARLNERIGGGPGPFWGCPPSESSSSLTTTGVPSDPLPTWRRVEEVLRDEGRRPFSSWQLLGAGAVGSQSLVGIARLARWRNDLVERGVAFDVWPFTTGLAVPEHGGERDGGCAVVVAEVWPTLFDDDTPRSTAMVRDEAQVRTVAVTVAALDACGALDAWFTPGVAPAGDAGDAVRRIVGEEGWILGVASGTVP